MASLTRGSIAAIVAACSLALQLLQGCDGSAMKPAIGREAPNFSYLSLDGSKKMLSDSRGSVVMLRFWADWCPPCATEFPVIERVYQEMSGKGLEVIAVNVRQSEARVKEYIGKFALSHIVALDKNGSISKQYDVRGLPMNFVIDRKGVVQEIVIGSISDVAVLKQYLTPHL